MMHRLKYLTTANGIKRPRQHAILRCKATVAALQEEERPRLEALRDQLKREITEGPVQIIKTVAASETPVAAAATKQSAPQIQEQPRNLQDWHDLLATLPSLSPQQSPLTDSFGRFHNYLRLSLTERCNFRCTYCMPPQGVPLSPPDHLLQTHELLELALYFQQAGVTKFRLTGGEPTLRRDVETIVAGLKQLGGGTTVTMTTNGLLLVKKLDALLHAGLDSVNLSLDTLDAATFTNLTRRPYLPQVLRALELLRQRNVPTKINCVLMRGVNDGEISNLIQLAGDTVSVRFIEYMPFSKNGWTTDALIPYQDVIQQQSHLEWTALPSDDPHDTTKWYMVNGKHKVGFITSMSSHFCAGCNRLRLGADGQIKVCLFDGSSTLSLRDALRAGLSQSEVMRLVAHAVQKKTFALGGHGTAQGIQREAEHNKPMTLIGG
jgi:molybdenum cofactor biosynthesis protein A